MVKRRTVKAPKGRQPRPVATLGGLVGGWLAGLDLGIYGQIGLVMLVGLASKNAILIVEFARDRRREGVPISQAAVEGGKNRVQTRAYDCIYIYTRSCTHGYCNGSRGSKSQTYRHGGL